MNALKHAATNQRLRASIESFILHNVIYTAKPAVYIGGLT
jgi:hypothetical protein